MNNSKQKYTIRAAAKYGAKEYKYGVHGFEIDYNILPASKTVGTKPYGWTELLEGAHRIYFNKYPMFAGHSREKYWKVQQDLYFLQLAVYYCKTVRMCPHWQQKRINMK